jgi:molecular chaperone GrpE (heat shock protein)
MEFLCIDYDFCLCYKFRFFHNFLNNLVYAFFILIVEMQQVYNAEFGPQEAEKLLNTEMTKEEKDAHIKKAKLQREQIKKGYGRVQEKIKEIRQNFSSAVVNGRRSGSGKIVFEHYDKLVKIYGGAASSEPINAGVDTDTFNCVNQSEVAIADEILGEDSSVDLDMFNDSNTASSASATNKRKPDDACIKLIDNKRKHMERTLSAAQRDQILMKESKEEMNFKKEMTEVMKESSKNTANAIAHMTTAIENIGSGLSRSIEMLATVFAHQQQQQYQHQWPPQPAQLNNFNFSRSNGCTQQPTPNNINAYVPENK